MEFLEGKTLDDLVGQEGPLDEERAITILRDIVAGAAFIHNNRLIHRDIKPSNVMVLPDGHAKLLDLGLALEQTSSNFKALDTVGGSIPFMAPEQTGGSKVDHRADVYAVGATLFFALSGKLPWRYVAKADRAELLESVRTTPRTSLREVAPHVSRRMANLVDRALSIEPSDRPTFDEFRAVLLRTSPWLPLTVTVAVVFCVLLASWRLLNFDQPSTDHFNAPLLHDLFETEISLKDWQLLTNTDAGPVAEVADGILHVYTKKATKGEMEYVAVMSDVEQKVFQDGTVAFSLSLDSLNTAAGVIFRWDNHSKSGYMAELIEGRDGHRDLALVRIDKNKVTLLDRQNVHFVPDRMFIMHVRFEGDAIDVTVWKDHTPMPAVPQISVQDDSYTSGRLGLVAVQTPFHEPGAIGAKFDNILFEVE